MEDDQRKQGKQAQGGDTFMTSVRQGGSPAKQQRGGKGKEATAGPSASRGAKKGETAGN